MSMAYNNKGLFSLALYISCGFPQCPLNIENQAEAAASMETNVLSK